jgi:hypothetical protein
VPSSTTSILRTGSTRPPTAPAASAGPPAQWRNELRRGRRRPRGGRRAARRPARPAPQQPAPRPAAGPRRESLPPTLESAQTRGLLRARARCYLGDHRRRNPRRLRSGPRGPGARAPVRHWGGVLGCRRRRARRRPRPGRHVRQQHGLPHPLDLLGELVIRAASYTIPGAVIGFAFAGRAAPLAQSEGALVGAAAGLLAGWLTYLDLGLPRLSRLSSRRRSLAVRLPSSPSWPPAAGVPPAPWRTPPLRHLSLDSGRLPQAARRAQPISCSATHL